MDVLERREGGLGWAGAGLGESLYNLGMDYLILKAEYLSRKLVRRIRSPFCKDEAVTKNSRPSIYHGTSHSIPSYPIYP